MTEESQLSILKVASAVCTDLAAVSVVAAATHWNTPLLFALHLCACAIIGLVAVALERQIVHLP